MGFQALIDMVEGFDMFRIVKVVDFEHSFSLGNAVFGQYDRFRFFIDRKILFAGKAWYDAIDMIVKGGGFFGRPRYN